MRWSNIMVHESAKDIDSGIKLMIEGAKKDYYNFATAGQTKNLEDGYYKDELDKWESLWKVTKGKKYTKVVRENGVFCFIINEDNGKWKKGDVLKAASWNAPALNKRRGNVLEGNYPIQWTGPLYLKSYN